MIYLGTDLARALMARLAETHPTGALLRNSGGTPWTKDAIHCAFVRLRVALGLRIMREQGLTVEKLPRFRKSEIEPARLAEARRDHRRKLALRRKEARRRALELSRKYHLGAFRKGYATESLKNGVDTITAAHLLGHANGAMMSRIYAKVQQDPAFMVESARRARGVSAGGDA